MDFSNLLQLLALLQQALVQGVDGAEDLPQVPGGEVRVIRLVGGRPVHEAPAVPGEVMPVPLGKDRPQQEPGLGVGRVHGGLHPADLLGRLVALDRPLEGDLLAERAEPLSGAVRLSGGFHNLVQLGHRGLGEAVLLGLLHFLPKGRRVLCTHETHHNVKNQGERAE